MIFAGITSNVVLKATKFLTIAFLYGQISIHIMNLYLTFMNCCCTEYVLTVAALGTQYQTWKTAELPGAFAYRNVGSVPRRPSAAVIIGRSVLTFIAEDCGN